MLVACDLDRTLLPNGHEPDDGMLGKFLEFMHTSEHTLVYVTGRNLSMVYEAKDTFGLGFPDYLIGDVGTTLYRKDEDGVMVQEEMWEEYVQREAPRWNVRAIQEKVTGTEELFLQEEYVQNKFKLSYYVKNPEKLTEWVRYVEGRAVIVSGNDVRVVGSVDPHKNLGLIDVLPTVATKETALQYLVGKLNLANEDVVYAGDSGNDILPLTSGYKAILVHNAPAVVKDQVQCIAQDKGIIDRVYFAHGEGSYNGNYASGVLEGLLHFGVLPKNSF